MKYLPQNSTFLTMTRSLLRCLLAIGLFLSPGLLSAQTADSLYLDTYTQPVDLQNPDFESLAILDTVVSNYRFFFSAEQHWRSINAQLQFAFLRYLHQQASVRHLIVEGGYSYGFMLNEYLQSGDERLLQKIMKDVPICPEDQMQLFRKIHAYNLDLPEKEKIQVTGIDLEHSPELVLQALARMLPGQEPPRKISRFIKDITRLHESPYFDEKEVRKYFKKLDRHIDRKEKVYMEFWGDDYDLFNLIVDNTLQGFQFTWIRSALFQKSWQERESRMYRNFLTISPNLKAGNYFAQFGALHTEISRSLIWDFPSLAQRLNSMPSSPVHGEVMTIFRYIRTFNSPKEAEEPDKETKQLEEIIDFIDQKFHDPVVLFSLVGKNSPFRELSKNFQFMVLIDEEVEEESCD